MFISGLRVYNYKSYLQSEWISLSPGLNVIVGKNSSGKSALLQALRTRFEPRPHRTEKTIPRENGAPGSRDSALDIEYSLSKSEFIDFARRYSGSVINIPAPRIPGEFADKHGLKTYTAAPALTTLHELLRSDLYFRARTLHDGKVESVRTPSFDLYDSAPAGNGLFHSFVFKLSPDNKFEFVNHQQIGPSGDIGVQLAVTVKQSVFVFDAERLKIGRFGIGTESILQSNAQNLPQVLAVLQSNRDRYNVLVRKLCDVFPDIRDISINPVESNQVEILVWPEHVVDRKDLAIPLNECGTGISQVLAILYAVVASRAPQIIAIDEPQSFLHPGAARKLIEVLKEYSQHQYIIATHSPNIIAACDPTSITVATLQKGETQLTEVNLSETGRLRLSLEELGVQLSDVFGADSILWVEGLTEQKSYPVIIREILQRSLSGNAIVGVKHTSDFERISADAAIEIYTRLSKTNHIFPQAVGFFFDREERTQKQMEDLSRGDHAPVRFTTRRMYENFLLNPLAIASVLNAELGKEFSFDTVSSSISEHRKNADLFPKGKFQTNDASWQTDVDGGELLKRVFYSLTEKTLLYRKPKHGPELTKWIARNSPNDLSEISSILDELLPKKP